MKKCVVAGCSTRGLFMFAKPIVRGTLEGCELVGCFDVSKMRADMFAKECNGINAYYDFDEMIKCENPDIVIVATRDCAHHEYIIRSLDAGIDVVSEKPMTTTREYAKQIMEAEKRSGKKVLVTFNLRYQPYCAEIKKLLQKGVIGNVKHIHLEWFLDKKHGADYFRRWHRYMENSSGLLVHKSTHHFDLVNWWLEKKPLSVYANCGLNVYGKNGKYRSTNCRECDYAKECEYYYNIAKDEHETIANLHINSEPETKYLRDSCVFSEDIDIYDTMSLNVKYEDDVTLNYSLTAYNPYEGWRVVIIGDQGRLEGGQITSGIHKDDDVTIKVINNQNSEIIYNMGVLPDGHGGGDIRLRKMLFEGVGDNELNQCASSYDGYLSLAIGDAANQSVKENRAVDILGDVK